MIADDGHGGLVHSPVWRFRLVREMRRALGDVPEFFRLIVEGAGDAQGLREHGVVLELAHDLVVGFAVQARESTGLHHQEGADAFLVRTATDDLGHRDHASFAFTPRFCEKHSGNDLLSIRGGGRG